MKHKVEFAFDDISQARVDAMREASGADSFEGLMVKALALFDDIFHHMKRGGSVILRDKDGTEYVMDRDGIAEPPNINLPQ